MTGLALATLLVLGSALTPISTAAQESGAGLAAGTAALIANAGGDPVLLREGPGYDATSLEALGEGTALEISDGPIVAADGSRWFGVTVDGRPGYVVADFLEPAAGSSLAAPVSPSPSLAPTAQPPLTTAQPAVAADAPDGAAVAREAVNLRAEPRVDAPVLVVAPVGSTMERTGDVVGDYLPVTYGGVSGYAAVSYLTLGGEPEAPATADLAPTPDAVPIPLLAAGTATTIDDVNLRAGPSTSDAVLQLLPTGAAVSPTGAASGGFLGVTYQGLPGWVDAAYLATTADPLADQPPTPSAAPSVAAPDLPAPGAPPPTAALDPGTAPAGQAALSSDLVNLRAGPADSEAVLRVLPPGGELTVTGGETNGFLPVWYNGTEGWIAAQYVAEDDAAPAAEPVPEMSAPAASSVAATGAGLIWPVSGGTWQVMQGYNGSSHQNNSSNWQYYYSLDLVKAEGETAGQPVVSPADGTVRWLDPSTGGISIDIGDGHAVALFHVTIDGTVGEGDVLTQGQVIGTVSGPGGPGFVGTAHVHLALWETGDGGSWSRSAAPFVGDYAISGETFPDTGGGNQYRGTTFAP